MQSDDAIRLFGDFQLLEELGSGRLGTVYKARQKSLDRVVALKIVHAEALKSEEEVAQFRRAVDAAAQVEHPGIVRTYNWGEQEGRHYIVTAYVAGRTLENMLAEQVLPPKEAGQFVRQAAEALHAAHQRGVLHNALHPGQIIVGADGQARITDLGQTPALAEWTTEPRLQPFLAAERLGLVHPRWQARGLPIEAVSPRSDVFSLGAILYTLVCGKPPFIVTDVPSVAVAMRMDVVVSPARLNPQVDNALKSICLECLRFMAQHRYYSAIELMADLLRWLNGRPLGQQQRNSWPRALKERVQQAAASSAMLLCVLLLGVLPLGWEFIYERSERWHADQVSPRADATAAQYQAALGSIEQRLRWHPHNRALQIEQGLMLCRLGRYADAKRELRKGWVPARRGSDAIRIRERAMATSPSAANWSWSTLLVQVFGQSEDIAAEIEADQHALAMNRSAWHVFEMAALETHDLDGMRQLFARLGSFYWQDFAWGSQPVPQQGAAHNARLRASLLRQLAFEPQYASLTLEQRPSYGPWGTNRSAWNDYVAQLAHSAVGGDPKDDHRGRARLLLEVLQAGAPPYRKIAADALTSAGPSAAFGMPELMDYYCRDPQIASNFPHRTIYEQSVKTFSDVIDSSWRFSSLGLPPEAIWSTLIHRLDDPDACVRYTSLHLLAKQPAGVEACVPQLLDRLYDDSPMVRILAARTLVRAVPKTEAIEALVRRLEWELPLAEEPRPPVDWGFDHVAYRELLVLLAPFGSDAARAVPVATRLIEAPSPNFAGQAMRLLARTGPEAQQATAALAGALRAGDQSTKVLDEATGNPTGVRMHDAAIETLAAIGPGAKDALPAMLSRLHTGGNYEDIPRRAAALEKIDPDWRDSPPGRDTLAAYVAGIPNRDERTILALGLYGPRAAVAVKPLIELATKAEVDSIHGPVIEVLGQIGPAAAPAVPWLAEQLERSNDRHGAASALGRIGPGAAATVPKLVPCLADTSEPVRQAAFDALQKIDPQWRTSGFVRSSLEQFRLKSRDVSDSSRQVAAGWALKVCFEPDAKELEAHTYRLELETSAGTMTFNLFADQAPQHVSNLIALVRAGLFDGFSFYSVVPQYQIIGAPLGNGFGLGHTIPAEPNDISREPGALSMYGYGNDRSDGSRFEISLKTPPTSTVFGRVADAASLDVARKAATIQYSAEGLSTVAKIVSARIIEAPKP